MKKLIVALITLFLFLPLTAVADTQAAEQTGLPSGDTSCVRWYLETEDEQPEVVCMPGESCDLTIDVLPWTEWSIHAEYITVQDGVLTSSQPINSLCDWSGDNEPGMSVSDGNVKLYGLVNHYLVTSQYTDEQGNTYTGRIRFSINTPPMPDDDETGDESTIAPDDQGNDETGASAKDNSNNHATSRALTVSAKVEQLVAQCRAAGITGEYNTALWFHDWLIYNANYDYTYSNYSADGVLLKGTGVCQSYALAYQLLLNAVGIQNTVIRAPEMDHAWNLVKINGEWCHVDCTWDDPNSGGWENHDYFGMNDDMILWDHTWNRSSYAASTSYMNYYYLRSGMPCVDSEQNMYIALNNQASCGAENLQICYVGTDKSFDLYSIFNQWYDQNEYKYGLRLTSTMIDSRRISLGADYIEPRVDSEQTMFSALESLASSGTGSIEMCYVGSDVNFDMESVFKRWYAQNTWKYGLNVSSVSVRDHCIFLSIGYNDPWGTLNQPVDAPSFALEGPAGIYRSSAYGNNSMILVFGSEDDPDTRSLMGELHGELTSLKSAGIEVLINILGSESRDDLRGLRTEYPNFHYTYGNWDTMYEMMNKLNLSYRRGYPFVVIIDSNHMITYYSFAYMYDMKNVLLHSAYATSTYHALPQPEKVGFSYDDQYSVNLSEVGSSAVQAYLMQLSAISNGILFMCDYRPYDSYSSILDSWEQNSTLYDRLGFRMVVCYETMTAEEKTTFTAKYPHVIFLDNDGVIYQNMLYAVSHQESSAYYLCNYFIDRNGTIVDYTSWTPLNFERCATKIALERPYASRLPASLSRIEAEAFANAPLTSIDLTSTAIVQIGDRAFANCHSLTLVKIPATVQSVGSGAFDGCGKLVLLCESGSAAETYALVNNIPCLVY